MSSPHATATHVDAQRGADASASAKRQTSQVANPDPSQPAGDAVSQGGGLLRWVPVAAAAAVMVGLLHNSSGPITDPDTLWHILAGQRLTQTWTFAGPDPFSRFSTLPWVYNQWLPEVAAAATAHVAGLAGVAWLAHLGRLLVFGCLLYACRRHAGPLAAVLAAVTGLAGAAGGLGPRPQLLGFCFLAVTVSAWLATERDGRIRWWLVPLTWVWASTHGTWIVGVAVGAVVCLGLLLDGKVRRPRVLLVPALSVVAASVTFVGPQLWQSALAINAANGYIQEWQAPTVRESSVAITIGVVLFIAVVWARRPESLSWTPVGLFALALVLCVLYLRTVSIAAIILAPLLAIELQRLIGRPFARPPRWEVVTYAAAFATSLLLAAVVLPATSSQPGKVPTGLDPTLAALPAGTVVWNTDALGGWLMWAHPNIAQTMDTRAEVYGPAYVDSYVKAMGAVPGWEHTLEVSGARYVLVGTETPLRSILESEHHWTNLGTDEGYSLLVAPTPNG